MNPVASFKALRFNSMGEPYWWWMTADGLRQGAGAVREKIKTPDERSERGLLLTPSFGLINVYALLLGLSLENLFKAEYLRQKKTLVRDGKLPQAIRSHDLLTFAGEISLGLNVEESRIVGTLSEAVRSWGRYPGDLTSDKGDIGPPDDFDVAKVWETFDALWSRVSTAMESEFEPPEAMVGRIPV